MKKYLSFLPFVAVLVMGCDSGPPCPVPGPTDKVGLFSREVGTVQIDGEPCKIFETYENTECYERDGFNHEPDSCSGKFLQCYGKVMTRITKCASGVVGNTITYTPDKFHREQVQ